MQVLVVWIGLGLGCGTAPHETPTCASCHPAQAARWATSHHALAERELGPDDDWARELGAVRVIGVHPLQQALVEVDGALLVHDQALDVRDGSRFGVRGTDAPLSWALECARCHNTDVRREPRPDGTIRTTVGQLGVGCPACHGEAAAHAQGGPPPQNARMDETCEACHSLRAELTETFTPGEPFLDHFLPVTIADPRFAPDGRGLTEVFAHNQFRASGMYAAGVRCGDCHDPHDGSLRAEGDALCVRCHVLVDHAAGACVDCHMPPTLTMGRHARRDHGFTRPGGRFTGSTPGRTVAALERDGDPAALRTALGSEDPRQRTAAASSLVPEGPDDVARLRAAARDPVRAVRVGAQRALVRSGMPLQQAPDYAAYLDLNAERADVRGERGLLRVASGDERGLADLRAARQGEPDVPDHWAREVQGLLALGRKPEALAVLDIASARFPGSSPVWYALTQSATSSRSDP